jgi:nicotinate-nucleotide adenylyltransferase
MQVVLQRNVEFYVRNRRKPERLAVLAGSFNPPTNAHLELIHAAGFHADEILFVIPRAFPHKAYFGATLEQRLEMMAFADPGFGYSIASTDAGLFVDIARECREQYSREARLFFVCGRDAAERVLTWDHGREGAVEEMLAEFELLVAARQGDFEPLREHRHRIHNLAVRGAFDEVSSTDVRERIARREPWQHLVPEEIVDRVREIYS